MNAPTLSDRIGHERLDRMLQSWIDEKPDDTLQKEIEGIFVEHLLALVADGTVRRYDLLPNRSMHIIRSWNGMFDGDAATRTSAAFEVMQRVCHPMLFAQIAHSAFDLRGKAKDRDARDGAIERLRARIDAGNAPWYMTGGSEQDYVSGESFAYEIVDWNLIVGRHDRTHGVQPIEDMPPVSLHEVEIDMPTGRVLLADWLSTGDMSDGFTDLVDEGNPWRGGSQVENERDAERYARDHGFVSVASAHRCLCVLTDGERITVGRYDEDGDHPVPAGFRIVRGLLVIDLRKVSVVDHSSLVSLYARIHDPRQAEELVSSIEKDHDTVAIDLTPGRYRVISSGRGHIGDLLEDGHPLKVEGYKPVMILEKV